MSRDVLGALVEHIETLGYAPTVRQLADRFGVGVATIHRDLERLAEEGRIERKGPRAIRIIEEGDSK